MPLNAILDVDGTLVDTNYHHALAWHRALHAHGHSVQMWKVHRHIGMGGDQILDALIGEEAAAADGEAISEAEAEAYKELIDEVEPLEGARELIEKLRDEGNTVILASSRSRRRSTTTSTCSTPANWSTAGPPRLTSRRPSPSPIWSTPPWRRPATTIPR
jgi:beta-phosphoglucomutase-like phosphatase (HAD superfamily)